MQGSSLDESIPTAGNSQVFSPTELKLLHKLDCSIENASLETKEFALYSVLGTLLGMYADSFTVFTGPDYRAFVHTTPQDTLTGHTWIQLGAGKMSLQAIPDMTVRITRLYQDQGGRDHHLVLTIEAKRLVGIHGRCHSDDLKNQAVEILPKHIGQLMFQAFSAWSESCKQGQLYVGILIGPYLTVLVFNHPPSHNPNNLPSSFTLPPHTHSEGDNMDGAGSLYGEEDDLVGTEESESMDAEHDKLLYAEGQHLCDAFPPEHAPQLVIYMEHIFKEPGDWRVGLSSPLQYIFDLATINIIKGFEPDIIQEPSGIFTFEGAPQTPYNVTTAEEDAFNEMIEDWYKTSKKEKGSSCAERKNDDDRGDDDYKFSDQPSSSPQMGTNKRKFRSAFFKSKKISYQELGV